VTVTNVHVYAWRASAVAVPPYARPVAERLRAGAWACLMCRGLESWHSWWCADCPGVPEGIRRPGAHAVAAAIIAARRARTNTDTPGQARTGAAR
jgi:hypothetical protein